MILSCQQSNSFSRFYNALKKYNIESINLPVIITKQVDLTDDIKNVINNILIYDYIILTSTSGVEAFNNLFNSINSNINKNKINIISVGKKTTQVIEKYGFKVKIQNPQNTAEELADYLINQKTIFNKNVLQLKGNIASPILKQKLENYCNYKDVVVYNTLPNTNLNQETLHYILENKIKAISFSSPSEIEYFLKIKEINPINKSLPIFCIGKTTAKYAQNQGFENINISSKADFETMAELIVKTIYKN